MKYIYTTLILFFAMAVTSYSQTRTYTKTNTVTSHHDDVHVDVHIDGHTGHHHDSHHHETETKQHKIKFNSGTLQISGIGELEILSTTGSEVIIESEVEDQDHDERSKGLRSINSEGIDDNTGLGISAIKDGSTLLLTQISKDCNCEGMKIYVPKAVKISVDNRTSHGDNIKISDINSEMIISTLYQNVELINITGPISVKTVYGQVEADFGKVNQNGSISINAVYGLVDVSLPSPTKATLQLLASYGEILTDMNIQVEKNGDLESISSTKVKGSINGGGVLINLKSSYDNVYLRSK